MRIRIPIPQVLAAIGVLAFGAVGLAVVAQYAFDMQPCPWCVFQRLVYIVVGTLALLAAVLSETSRRGLVALAFIGTLVGIASALWQQLRAVSESSCDLSLAERIISALHLDSLVPQLFVAYASCAEAAVSVFHIPFAIWSCAMFVILALLLVWISRSSMTSQRSAF